MVDYFYIDWRKSSKRENDYFNYNSINLERIIEPLYSNYISKEIPRYSNIKGDIKGDNFYEIKIPKIDYSSSLGSSLFDKLLKQPTED